MLAIIILTVLLLAVATLFILTHKKNTKSNTPSVDVPVQAPITYYYKGNKGINKYYTVFEGKKGGHYILVLREDGSVYKYNIHLKS